MALGGALVGTAAADFPAGWNNQARTPPMGWRSWNAFGAGINPGIIQESIDALTSRARTVDGKNTSLADVGYVHVGIDEGWEGCNEGVDGTQHDAAGLPVINANFNGSAQANGTMASLAAYARARDVKLGWYFNGCACGEQVEKVANYRGDISSLSKFSFEGVKFDNW
jgi:alpha-galactosidase